MENAQRASSIMTLAVKWDLMPTNFDFYENWLHFKLTLILVLESTEFQVYRCCVIVLTMFLCLRFKVQCHV